MIHTLNVPVANNRPRCLSGYEKRLTCECPGFDSASAVVSYMVVCFHVALHDLTSQKSFQVSLPAIQST